MKIKSYKLFLESKIFDISKEEELLIKEYFYDRLDGEIIDGIEINGLSDSDESELFDDMGFKQKMNSFKFSKRVDQLDRNGEDDYHSKILKQKKPFFWDSNSERTWKREFIDKEFSTYTTIIVNIKFESDSIIPYLNQIYNNLIHDDYLVSAWHPGPNIWRFHIATKSSNPFQEINNSLDKLWGTY
jgi:hypothetical protein